MTTGQADEKNAEYAPMYWVIDYVLSGAVFLQRAMLLWRPLQNRPIDVLQIVDGGLMMLYCFLPVWAGRSFKRMLKRESENEALSMRTFTICDWRIAQLLLITYLAMLLFGIRS
jgi:hypothetical protein